MKAFNWNRTGLALIGLMLMLVFIASDAKASSTLQVGTDYAAIDAYVTAQMDDLGIPGMALGIVQDGQIAHLQGFGQADSGGRPVRPQTPFHLGSVSKSFTALAVLQLVEEGKIDLDAPVQTYLPWFELADEDASARITVRHLLNQTTGISTRDGNGFWANRQSLEEVVRGLDTIEPTQPVGAAFQYSNINYGIAGLIVEKVSGQPYADYVTQHIFEQLGMDHSFASGTAALDDSAAEGHYYLFGQVIASEMAAPPVYVPSGFLVASAEDLAKYTIAQLNGGVYAGATVLSPQGIDVLHTPAIAYGDDYYAMGWNLSVLDGRSIVWHDGDDGRNHTIIFLMPDSGSGVILLANASGFVQLPQVNEIAKGVARLLDGQAPAPIAAPFQLRFLYWAILLAPLLQFLGIAYAWRKRWRVRGWGVLAAVILNLIVVIFLLVMSRNIPFPLGSMLVFFPELGYGLIVLTALGIGWSTLYPIMYLVLWRTTRREAAARQGSFVSPAVAAE